MNNGKNILEQFVGNDVNHVGYKESFKGSDFLMPLEELEKKMAEFSKNIQKACSTK